MSPDCRETPRPAGPPGSSGATTASCFGGALGAEKRFTYAFGAFDGLDGPANQDSDLMYSGRLSYNFWNVEDNPGYYTSSTYYGKAGDILTLAASTIYHQDGVGTATDSGNFRGTSVVGQ